MEDGIHDQRLETGRKGESLAADYLKNQEYQIIELNWRCRIGEIDIIARHGSELIFVEVRTRKQNAAFGTAAESVNNRKQAKIKNTAQTYLSYYKLFNCSIRFDVITVKLDHNGELISLEHIMEAF